MQDWKMTDESAGLENAGLENNGLEFAELVIWRTGNATPVRAAMRQTSHVLEDCVSFAASHKPAAGEVGDWTRRRRGLCCEFLEVLAAFLPVVVEAGPVRSEQDPSRVSAVCRPPSSPS